MQYAFHVIKNEQKLIVSVQKVLPLCAASTYYRGEPEKSPLLSVDHGTYIAHTKIS